MNAYPTRWFFLCYVIALLCWPLTVNAATVAMKEEPGLLRLTLSAPINREVRWSVQFEKSAPTVATENDAKETYMDLRQASCVAGGWGTPQNNASVDGAPLRIGTTDFAQGIGIHAPAEMVFSLAGKYRWLTFYTGVSAAMSALGSVNVQVWTDGKLAFETGVMKIREEPRYVCLPITGVKELKLVGTDAGDGIQADHLNLCNLRLSTREQAPQARNPTASDLFRRCRATRRAADPVVSPPGQTLVRGLAGGQWPAWSDGVRRCRNGTVGTQRVHLLVRRTRSHQ